jgi:hypothetical protein
MTMRKLLILAVLAALLVTPGAWSQETYTISAGAANVTTLSAVIMGQNGTICATYALTRTCTQAQVCTAAGTPGGSGCTAVQARTAGVRIYPLTQAGREEYVTFGIALPRFLELVAAQTAETLRATCTAWNALSQSARDTFCTGTLGLPAGCNFGCP